MRLRSRLVLILLIAAVPLVAGIVWLRGAIDDWLAGQMMGELARYRIESLGRERCEAAPELLGRPFGPGGFGPPFLPVLPPGPGPRAEGTRLEGPVPAPRAPDGAGAPPLPDGEPPPWRRGMGMGSAGPWGRGAGPPLPGGGPPFGRRPLQIFAYDADFVSRSSDAPPLPASLRERLAQAQSHEPLSFTEKIAGEHWQTIAIHTGWDSGPCAYVVMRGPRPRRLPRERTFLVSAIALAAGLVAAVWIAIGPVIRRVRRLAREVRLSAATRYEQPVPIEGQDEVADLARAFNAAGVEVRRHLVEVAQREEALRSFLANTTHDLAIPLSVLLGHLSAMRRALERGARISEVQVAAATDEASHLGALVHNLGAVAKLEAGEGLMRRDAFDLGTLLERVVERHRPLADARHVELVSAIPPDAPVRIEGDLTLLEQALGNLVANAVLYNRAGGHVAVILETPRAEPPRFRLKVVDDGPGVGVEELPHLGERHFRGAAGRVTGVTGRVTGITGRADHVEGQGLGLHIAREVAGRHGFTLTFAPAEGGGLEASLEGPRAAVQAR